MPDYPVFTRKAATDVSYIACATKLLEAPEAIYPAFATHDERLIARAARRARELGVPPEKFEIQMLYGIRHDLHAPIREQGLRLRVLVPFGEEWYGYFVRRVAERPANLLFLLKNLVRG